MWCERIPRSLIGARVGVALCLTVLSSACGYQFMAGGGRGPVIGGGEEQAHLRALRAQAPRLVVEPVENKTFEPDLETRYTDFIRREFASSSGAQVVPHSRSAELRLRTTIDSVSIPSLSFTRTTTLESRAVVAVSARVEDIASRKVVWQDRVTAASEFFITDDIQFNRVLQTRAVEQAGEQIASDLAARFLVHLESMVETEGRTSSPDGAPPAP